MGSFHHRDAIPTDLACVFFVDITYGQVDESGFVPEENDGWNNSYKRKLEHESGEKLEDADIGPGASFPAFLLEIAASPLPYVAGVIAIFFSGKKLEENLDAWPRLFQRFSSLLKRDVFLSRTAAAAYAINCVYDDIGGLPKTLVLKKYHSRDVRFSEPEPEEQSIEDDQRVEYQGTIEHYFIIEADGVKYKAIVAGNQCAVSRI